MGFLAAACAQRFLISYLTRRLPHHHSPCARGLIWFYFLSLSLTGETNAFDATTTICHRYTPADQLRVFVGTADIIVTAAGGQIVQSGGQSLGKDTVCSSSANG